MAKKIAVALFAISACFHTIHAQIQAKSILLGGEINYYNADVSFSSGLKDQKNSNSTFNISAGKAIKENCILGVNLSYMPSSVNNYFAGAGNINGTLRSYSAGVFYRQYKKLAKDFYFFTEAGAAYNSAKQSTADTSGNYPEVITQTGFQVTLTPGIAYRIMGKLYLEILIPDIFSVQYAITKDNLPTQAQSAQQKQISVNTSLNASGLSFLGVGFHLIL